MYFYIDRIGGRGNAGRGEYPTAEAVISAISNACASVGKGLGEMRIVGGSLHDDSSLSRVSIVNTEGCDFHSYGGEIEGLFLE